jgi:D-alanine--poly(phosphoribitol) ligase subunit 1
VARIVAFVVASRDDGHVPDTLRDWKEQLAARLPLYTIPSELLARESLPMSVNFKTDRARLAEEYRDRHLKAGREPDA